MIEKVSQRKSKQNTTLQNDSFSKIEQRISQRSFIYDNNCFKELKNNGTNVKTRTIKETARK